MTSIRIALFLAFSFSATASQLPGFVYSFYNATFENDDGGYPSIYESPFPVPGYGFGLYYDFGLLFENANYPGTGCAGVCPTSYPNDVYFNATSAGYTGYISSQYNGSQVVSFALRQFDAGCLNRYVFANPQNGEMVYVQGAGNCTVEVHGESLSLGHVFFKRKYTTKNLRSASIGVLTADMETFVLPPTFNDLTRVWFNATNDKDTDANGTFFPNPSLPYAPELRMDGIQTVTRNLSLPLAP